MNWMKYSNAQIEVTRVRCHECDNDFYEIVGNELDYCPMCEAPLDNTELEVCDYEYYRIYADPKTGEVKVWGKD